MVRAQLTQTEYSKARTVQVLDPLTHYELTQKTMSFSRHAPQKVKNTVRNTVRNIVYIFRNTVRNIVCIVRNTVKISLEIPLSLPWKNAQYRYPCPTEGEILLLNVRKMAFERPYLITMWIVRLTLTLTLTTLSLSLSRTRTRTRTLTLTRTRTLTGAIPHRRIPPKIPLSSTSRGWD